MILPGGADEAHDRELGDRLTAARLAHHAHYLFLLDAVADVVDGFDQAVVGLELGAEVVDF